MLLFLFPGITRDSQDKTGHYGDAVVLADYALTTTISVQVQEIQMMYHTEKYFPLKKLDDGLLHLHSANVEPSTAGSDVITNSSTFKSKLKTCFLSHFLHLWLESGQSAFKKFSVM